MAALRQAILDQRTVERYHSHIHPTPTTRGCHLWTGAISGRGHGRFWIGTYTTDPDGNPRTRDITVIAHRYGWALTHDLDSLLTAHITHLCDEPLCQTPDHWRAGNASSNRNEYLTRSASIGSPLRDTRGALGRARALRTTALAAGDLDATHSAGLPPIDQHQPPLWPD